ncbi:MAG: hypothetical protein BGO97_07255 [Micrococcales bacterium 70-64]|nr:DUF4097 family beta strand repeat protein [Leifsonia sp.]ODU63851.1 MAG: hypothetical protein ABT06_07260 [Leifsonia sp. SCN 70-46]OJX85542.1 MAG: hypothetical protein BGO97_07255 [Micrococcales bacterium 70-64]
MAQEKWLVADEKVIDIDNVRKLKVGLVAGQVSIVAHDEPHVHVEVHSVSGKDLLVSVDGDTLAIDHAQWSWDNFIDVFKSFRGSARADVSIKVPRDISLKFGVVSASALISGLTEDASISTVSGDIIVDGLYGDVQLNAVSGEISVRNHYGRINVHSISGDITAAGELMRFSGDTVSGDVFLDISGVPDEVQVNTVSGSITTRLEADVPAQYKINTVSGRIQLDDSEIRGIRGSYTSKYGSLDRQWVEFKANTVSGSISVLHQVSA